MRANAQLQDEIAERRRAEAASRASEERFFAMFASSPAGMVLSSLPDLRYVAVNDSWLRITGFTREQVIGRTAEEVGLLDPDEQRRALRGRSAGRAARRRHPVPSQRTAQRHGLVSTQRLTVNGEPLQFTTLVDITDRVRARGRPARHQPPTEAGRGRSPPRAAADRRAGADRRPRPARQRHRARLQQHARPDPRLQRLAARQPGPARQHRDGHRVPPHHQHGGPGRGRASSAACATSTAVARTAMPTARSTCQT